MTIHTCRHFAFVWPVALVATLTLAPGCSGGREEKSELTPVWDDRGIVTYHDASAGPAAPVPSISSRFVPRQPHPLDVESRQSGPNERNDHEVRREREEQRQRERQEFEAYQETRRQYEREQHRQQLEQERFYQQQQREAFEQQKQRTQAEALQRQQRKNKPTPCNRISNGNCNASNTK